MIHTRIIKTSNALTIGSGVCVGVIVIVFLLGKTIRSNNRANSIGESSHTSLPTKLLTKKNKDRRALQIEPSKHRRHQKMITTIRDLDIDECRAMANHTLILNATYLELIYERWMQLDPWSAFEFALQRQIEASDTISPNNRHDELSYLMRAWLRTHPDAAIDHIQSRMYRPDILSRKEIWAYATEWIRIDPHSAFSWLATLNPQIADDNFVDAIRQKLEGDSTVKAPSIVTHINHDDRLLHRIDTTRSLSDQLLQVLQIVTELPPNEFKYFAQELRKIPYRNRWIAQEIFFESWAQKSPAEAMNFIKTQDQGCDLTSLMIMRIWGRNDPERAIHFMTQKEASFQDDPHLLIPACRELSFTHPQKLVQILPEIQDLNRAYVVTELIKPLIQGDPLNAAAAFQTLAPKHQKEVILPLIEEWKKADSSALAAWVKTLPAEIKKHTDQNLVNPVKTQSSH